MTNRRIPWRVLPYTPRVGLPGWKKLEKSAAVGRLKTRLRQLIGTELRIDPDLAVAATVNDAGWVYDASRLNGDSIVYSLGVGDTIDFDLALIERSGASVYAFDPTPDAETTLDASNPPPGFRFRAWAAAGEDGELTLYPRVRSNGSISSTMFTLQADERTVDLGRTVPAYTVAGMAKQLGHDRVDLLKMDIEGAEYAVIESLLCSALRPPQVLIEFHHRHKGIGKQRTIAAIQAMQAAGYAIFYVSPNVREFSFLKI